MDKEQQVEAIETILEQILLTEGKSFCELDAITREVVLVPSIETEFSEIGIEHYTISDIVKNAEDLRDIALFIFNQKTDYKYADISI